MTAGYQPPKCPRCFNQLPADAWTWTPKDPESVDVDPEGSRYSGRETTLGQIVSHTPASEEDYLEFLADHDEICPTCHYTLLPRWRFSKVMCVAMAGARYTGKTVYIAVLVKALQRLGDQFGQVVDCADDSTRERYRDVYEQPLYEHQGLAEPTPSANTYEHRPLIFSLGFWNNDQLHYLVIRDVAGEDLEEPRNIRPPVLDFFARADAVFFLFDPLRVPAIRDQLADFVPVADLGGDPSEVLETVLRLIGSGTPRIAVILSKFDALQKLAHVEGAALTKAMSNPGAAFNRDPGLLSRNYDEIDGALIDAETHSLLQRLGAGPRLRRLTNPLTHAPYDQRYFVVSALGESPEGARLHHNGISSFRCADPVRWLLSGTGVLEVTEWAGAVQ